MTLTFIARTVAMAALIVLVGCKTAEEAYSEGHQAWLAKRQPSTDSSHDAEYLRQLYSGRTLVAYERRLSSRVPRRVLGIHHGLDGEYHYCRYASGQWRSRSGRWEILTHPKWLTFYHLHDPSDGPNTFGRGAYIERWARAVYDEETGGLKHTSVRIGSEDYVLTAGWLQEGWPAVLQGVCPLQGVSVNALQTAEVFDDMRAQDPDAPVRHFRPVAERFLTVADGNFQQFAGLADNGAALGAVGDFLRRHAGEVLTGPEDDRFVYRPAAGGDTMLRLDVGGAVADTGRVTLEFDGRYLAVLWQDLSRTELGRGSNVWTEGPQITWHRVGAALPWRSTGERYAPPAAPAS